MPKGTKAANNSSQKKTAANSKPGTTSKSPSATGKAPSGNPNGGPAKNIDESDVVDEFSFEFTADDIRRMLMDKSGSAVFANLSNVMGSAAANFHNNSSGANDGHPGLPPDETELLMRQLRKQAASASKSGKTPAEIDAANSPASLEQFFRYMYSALQYSGADTNKGIALPPPTANVPKSTSAATATSATTTFSANTKRLASHNKVINPRMLTPLQKAAAMAAAKAAGATIDDDDDELAEEVARLSSKSKAARIDPAGSAGDDDDDNPEDEDGLGYAPEIQSLLRELQQANLAELDAVIAQTVAAADGKSQAASDNKKSTVTAAEEVEEDDEFEDDEVINKGGKKKGGPLGRKRAAGNGPAFEDLDAQSQMNILQLYPELISRMSQRSAAAVATATNTTNAQNSANMKNLLKSDATLPAEHELALLALAALTGKTSAAAASVQRSYEKLEKVAKAVSNGTAQTLASARQVVSQFQNIETKEPHPPTEHYASAAADPTESDDFNDSCGEDGMPDDGDILHKEDLRQINTLMDRLEPLTLETVHELCQEWGVPTKSSPSATAGTPESRQNDHLFFSTSIAERMRYLSAAVVVCVAERFHHLHNSTPMCRDAKERTTMISNLVLRLGKSLKELDPKVRANFSTVFGFTTPSPSAEEVCVAVMCVGIVAFFQPISIPTLERVCEEFGITDYHQALVDCDPDFIHDILANRLCEYFYPEIRTLARNFNASSLLSILTIHENGPGSYTCHIDNASLIGVVPKQVTISNTFNCKKMKWRAQVLLNNDQALSFITWHHTPHTYRVRATIRSSNAPKVPGLVAANTGGKKGGNNAANQPADANASLTLPKNTNNPADWPTPPQHIYVSAESIVLPGQRFVLDKLISLEAAYAALTTLQAGSGGANNGSILRIYNRADDRLTLQFSLEILEILEAPLIPGIGVKRTDGKVLILPDGATVHELMIADAKAEQKIKSEKEKKDKEAAQKAAKDAAEKEKAEQAAAATAAAEAAKKKKEPPLTKAQQQALAKQAALEKKIKSLETQEETGRERNIAAEVTAWALLDTEIKKSHEKKLAKQREREKKLVEELSKPDPNLQAQLSQLQQTVHAARTAVTKQNQDRTKDLKDLEKLREQLGRRTKELESLRKLFDDQQTQLEEAEEEIAEVERRTAEKESVIQRREEARRLRAWDEEDPMGGAGGHHNQERSNHLVPDPTASLLTFNTTSQQHSVGGKQQRANHPPATAGLSNNGRGGFNNSSGTGAPPPTAGINNAANNNVSRFWADAANDAVFNPNVTNNSSRNGNGTPVSLSNNANQSAAFGNSFGGTSLATTITTPSAANTTQQQQRGRNGSTPMLGSTPSASQSNNRNNQRTNNNSAMFGYDSTSLAPPSPAGGSTSAGFSLGPQSVGSVSPIPQFGAGTGRSAAAKEWTPSSFTVAAGDSVSHNDSAGHFDVTSSAPTGFTVTSSASVSPSTLPTSTGSATNPNAAPFVPRSMTSTQPGIHRSNSNNNNKNASPGSRNAAGGVSMTMGTPNSVFQLQQQLQMTGLGGTGMMNMSGGANSAGYGGGGVNGSMGGIADPFMRSSDMYGNSPGMMGGYDPLLGPMGGPPVGGAYGLGAAGMHMGGGGGHFQNQGLGLGYGIGGGLDIGMGGIGSGAAGSGNGAIGLQSPGTGVAPGGSDGGFQLTANAVNAGGLMIRQQQQQYQQQPPYSGNSRPGSLYWGQ